MRNGIKASLVVMAALALIQPNDASYIVDDPFDSEFQPRKPKRILERLSDDELTNKARKKRERKSRRLREIEGRKVSG